MARVIATHSGTFHCDEALACFLLLRTRAFAGARVVRTRDASAVASADAAVDVGGQYDGSRHRYDHHQRGFDETMGGRFRTRLSSAGLVYRHHGREVVAAEAAQASEGQREALYWKLYERFVEAIDAIDNGVDQYEAAGAARYRINTDLASRVAALNPAWNRCDLVPDVQFEKAMALAGGEFLEHLRGLHEEWLPARALVEAALAGRHDVDQSGEVIVLEQACPWKGHLFELEQALSITPSIKYALFTDSLGKWRVQAVPIADGSFHCRLALPEPWRGKRDADLDAVAAIDGCVFVHAAGFIGGHATRDGALAMARKSLALARETGAAAAASE